MPYNTGENHWKLAVANFQLKTFIDLDPFFVKETEKSTKATLHKFIKYLLNRNKVGYEVLEDVEKWEVISAPSNLPRQSDAVSCGLYVIHYAGIVIGHTTTDFDPVESRRQLADILLEQAGDMRHLCGQCGHDQYFTNNKNFSLMAQCCNCLRWFHRRCAPVLKEATCEEINASTFQFCCHICASSPSH